MTTKKATKKPTPEEFTREARFVRESANDDERTIEVAFSSEIRVERYWGDEILSHGDGACDLERLNSGAAVMVGHDDRQHVGVVVENSARIDSDRKGRAVLRFGRGALASEIFEDVKDGIRQLVSVGYRVFKWEVNEKTDTRTALEWQPFEISLVSVPADHSVGVNRNLEREDTKMSGENDGQDNGQNDTATDTRAQPGNQAQAPVVDVKAQRAEATRMERQRINAITKVGAENDMDELAREFIDDDKSVADFNSRVLEEIGKRNNEKRQQGDSKRASHWGDLDNNDDVDLSEKEKRQFSLFNVMNALANPNDKRMQEAIGLEREVSDAAAQKFDINVRGIYIPNSVPMARSELSNSVQQRNLSAGSATDGAELVGTNLLAGSFIDVLRNLMVTRQAGARMMTGLVGNVDVPRKVSGASATWIGAEDGDATESEAQFDQVSLAPKDLAAYTEVTRRLLMQSTPAAEGLVRDDLAQAQALGLDYAGLYGTATGGQPRGVANQTGINTFNFAAADPVYAETVRMIKEVMLDNALMGSLGYIIDPNGWEAAMITEKATNTAKFLLSENNTINGRGIQVSNQVTAEDWFFGNWNDLMYGIWGGVELNVDPYTHSLKGRVRFVTFQTADVAVRHPVSFCHCNDGA
ncbi:MAG: phage major capsid protein [Pseudomonadota bacterium]